MVMVRPIGSWHHNLGIVDRIPHLDWICGECGYCYTHTRFSTSVHWLSTSSQGNFGQIIRLTCTQELAPQNIHGSTTSGRSLEGIK